MTLRAMTPEAAWLFDVIGPIEAFLQVSERFFAQAQRALVELKIADRRKIQAGMLILGDPAPRLTAHLLELLNDGTELTSSLKSGGYSLSEFYVLLFPCVVMSMAQGGLKLVPADRRIILGDDVTAILFQEDNGWPIFTSSAELQGEIDAVLSFGRDHESIRRTDD